ncbi:MAG: sigma-70 family RNA polymerase sigma factor [Acidobacteriota bacterium]
MAAARRSAAAASPSRGAATTRRSSSTDGGPSGRPALCAAASYAPVFAGLVKLTGDRDLAADLTQETFRKAWRSLAGFDRRARFATWLYRIAYTTFLNHVRRPRPVEPLEAVPESRAVDVGPTPDDRLDRREVAERLRRAVLGLPEELRFTVTARFWGEVPVREIAAAEDVTGAAIRKRLKTATARLRQTLEEDAA